MKLEKGICSVCGRETLIENRTRMLCANCNYRRLHKGMSRYEVLRKMANDRKERVNRRFRNTGERELFLRIWNQRLHICNRCGKWLGDEPKPVFFSHIKSKGAHPELRLDPNNIELLCEDCHHRYEFGRRDV